MIPIVNHTWVEDCFVQWSRLTPARDKYIVFLPGVTFSAVLTKCGIGCITWEPGELEEMQHTADVDGTSRCMTRRTGGGAGGSGGGAGDPEEDEEEEQER